MPMRLALVVATATGCQTPRRVTWEDAAEPSVVAGLPPPATSAIVTPAGTAVPPAVAPASNASSGILVDRALVALNTTRAQARRQGSISPLWSKAWLTALAEIDEAVQRPPVASDLGAFVRCRMTLEVELVNDRLHGAVLPSDLERRVERTLLAVDESVVELRAANAPGTTLAPMARLDDGDLILRAPVSPMVVSSPFGRRRDPFTGSVRYHAGVDLDAREGAAVYAAASGIVVYAGPQGGYGRYIVVDHGDGVRSHYAHLSAIRCSLGALVVEGDVIGLVGSTGRSTGPHLHFAVTNNLGAFLDPVAVLDVPFKSLEGQVAAKPH